MASTGMLKKAADVVEKVRAAGGKDLEIEDAAE